MLASLVLAAALFAPVQAAADAPTTVEGVSVTAAPPPSTVGLTDQVIEAQLFKLLESDPERVVCAEPPRTGTRLPQPVCGSLRRWFDARTPAEVIKNRAPWALVEEIKKNKRKASARRRG